MSVDHKPENTTERSRIKTNGGKVYRSHSKLSKDSQDYSANDYYGPYRVLPGKLSVSRSIGDFKAKDECCGGNDKVLIATPDVQSFDINEHMNYLLLATDGLFETQSNRDVFDFITRSSESNRMKNSDFHNFIGELSTNLLKHSVEKQSQDNIS